MTTTINLDLLNKARLRQKRPDKAIADTDNNIINLIPQEIEYIRKTDSSDQPINNMQSVIDAAEVKKEELRQQAQIKSLQAEIDIKNEDEKRRLLEAQFKIAETERALEEKKAKTQKFSDQRRAKETAIQREIVKKEQLELDKINTVEQEHKNQLQQLETQKKVANEAHVWKWLKMTLITLFSLVIIGYLLVMLFWLYRWATEEPITIEVEKVVEKIVVKNSEIAEIAPNCIKLTQDGETLFNCAGQTYRVDTLSLLTADQIAEIKASLDKKAVN